MTWDGALDKASKAVDIFIKAELHAIGLIVIGLAAAVKGHSQEGGMVLAAGLAIFKGNR